MMRKFIQFIGFIMLIGLLTTSSLAQEDITLDLGTIPAGQQITITYDVTVNDDLPAGALFITNQAVVSGQGFNPVLSDDPDTIELDDATRTQLGFTLQVTQLPQTGENPFYRHVLISALIGFLVTIGGMITLKRFNSLAS